MSKVRWASKAQWVSRVPWVSKVCKGFKGSRASAANVGLRVTSVRLAIAVPGVTRA